MKSLKLLKFKINTKKGISKYNNEVMLLFQLKNEYIINYILKFNKS